MNCALFIGIVECQLIESKKDLTRADNIKKSFKIVV